MQCPECQFENREGVKFCEECGAKMELKCPQCGAEIPLGRKFCGQCGQELAEPIKPQRQKLETESERKYVTVLFSDLSGFTSLSERLDPEEVKEITTRIFGEISGIIDKYEGFIEKFAGDAVMALFGVPEAHEDDPIRAIRAAKEIHKVVRSMNPEIEMKIGQPLSMHSGINTGLVVTGEVNLERGTHGVTGDALNVASRLSSLAKVHEILVGQETFRQALGYFEFEAQEPVQVKGKAEPILNYKVVSSKERPVPLHRLSILRAELIGRRAEMEELREAVSDLKNGKGRIFSISGDAGTGKSRLVEEFKAGLNLNEIQWLEGHAYAYCQNIPYFPLIDLLNRIFQIDEEDHPESVREKVESRIKTLLGNREDVIPYIGSLYSLNYSEVEGVSPETWKRRLQESIKAIFSSLALKSHTVIFLEDLHWADPSFVELLRNTLLGVRQPAIVLCVHRPTFSLYTSHQLGGLEKIYREIRLVDLSPSEAQDMLASLLKSPKIPSDLRRLVQDKAEGNPFYLEELVNSLIESETLIRENGNWTLTGPIRDSDISSTIHGIIAGRLDRLEKESKRVLQEASVIGRSFLYEVLRRISELKQNIEGYLRSLEQFDLIRPKSLHPDLEYIFKHALTQEVVYNGLLIRERKDIHERIALAMEDLFSERLPEFYEALAFHFKRGHSDQKAVDYLMKSGEKSLGRYAVEESHQYFKEAFQILGNKTDRSEDEDSLLIALIVKWAYVYYYMGDFKGLTDLLGAHQSLAETITDRAVAGMFYGWLGMALWSRERYMESQRHLLKALQIGEELGDRKVIGYACTWLTWTCAELGLLDEALKFGERAQSVAKDFPADHYLFFKSLGGIGFAHYYRGEGEKALEAGRVLVEFGERNSDIRSMVMGHYITGLGHYISGDLASGIKSEQRAVQISADPYYRQFPRLFEGICCFLKGEFDQAEEALVEVADFSREYGTECLGTPAAALLGAVLLSTGELKRGLKMVEENRRRFEQGGRKWCVALTDIMLGQFYLQVATGGGETNLPFMLKNLPFLVSKLPFAGNKAKQHFLNCIEMAEEIGAHGLSGESYMGLALLHRSKGRKDEAAKSISEAIRRFEKCELETPLQQAKDALASI